MVFTPENRKKLDNVTVVQYRGRQRVYEIIAIPNKLYEYKRNPRLSLDEVLHTQSIFTDSSRGELARADEIKQEFGGSSEDALRKILEQGSEQKDKATREYEQSTTRKLIVDGVSKRLRTSDGRPVTQPQVEELLRTISYVQTTKPPKVQVNLIIKRLLPLGYTRRVIRMRADGPLNLQEITDSLPDGSSCTMTGQMIEATDDLYGPIHRLAEALKVKLTDLDV